MDILGRLCWLIFPLLVGYHLNSPTCSMTSSIPLVLSPLMAWQFFLMKGEDIFSSLLHTLYPSTSHILFICSKGIELPLRLTSSALFVLCGLYCDLLRITFCSFLCLLSSLLFSSLLFASLLHTLISMKDMNGCFSFVNSALSPNRCFAHIRYSSLLSLLTCCLLSLRCSPLFL